MIYLKLFCAFFKIGLFAFGGGYAMLPLIEQEIVSANGWLTASEFVDLVAIAQMTPGPIAINAATFVGTKTGGVLGGITTTLGVVTPSLILILFLAISLKGIQNNPLLKSIFRGLRPAVVALIATAALFVGETAVKDIPSAILAVTVFVLSAFTPLHPILLIVLAGAAGLILF